jgi:hypothetical protein
MPTLIVRASENPSANLLEWQNIEGIPLSVVKADGSIGIGTPDPEYKLDVEGTVQAHDFITGDITFRKDGKKLWRMFEDEKGLYVENLSTGKTSKVFLEEDIEALKEEIIEELKSQ